MYNTPIVSIFSDPHPKKSKAKCCMACLQKRRELPDLKLCGTSLPWVETGKLLGTRIENIPGSILNQDIRQKRAQYATTN